MIKEFKKTLIYTVSALMIAPAFTGFVYAKSEEEVGNIEEISFINLTEEEAKKGGEIVERKGKPLGIKNVLQLKMAQDALKAIAEQREYDLPNEALSFNPNKVYELSSIRSRIKLIGVVIAFIKRISTEGIYKVQEVHNIASREAFASVVTALNIFSGSKAVDKSIEKMTNLADELMKYPDLTADDWATKYIKRIFNKDVREARKYNNQFIDEDTGSFGVKGKPTSVQVSYKNELESLAKMVRGNVKVGTLIEVDNSIKSLATTALLAEEYRPSQNWLKNTADFEINEVQKIRNNMRSVLSKEDLKSLDDKIKLTKDERYNKNTTYDKVSNAIYNLRELVDELSNKYVEDFKKDYELVNGNRLKWYAFFIPRPQVDPGRLLGISWLNNPSFDFEPVGFIPDSKRVPIVVGFKQGRVQYGSYDEWRHKRTALRGMEDVVSPEFNDPDEIDPGFDDSDDGGIIIDFNY